jgi:catechol 2,3-dioxygenase-like lactoylglutathione lyase family enzyme
MCDWKRPEEEGMVPYVDATEQLVVEIFVRDIQRSRTFYERLGFEVLADRGGFVELAWEGHQLFLDERPDLPPLPGYPQANVRVMVADVDAFWERARDAGAQVLAPIEDRFYGLRDFTILDPDGFGVRFGSRLPQPRHPSIHG